MGGVRFRSVHSPYGADLGLRQRKLPQNSDGNVPCWMDTLCVAACLCLCWPHRGQGVSRGWPLHSTCMRYECAYVKT